MYKRHLSFACLSMNKDSQSACSNMFCRKLSSNYLVCKTTDKCQFSQHKFKCIPLYQGTRAISKVLVRRRQKTRRRVVRQRHRRSRVLGWGRCGWCNWHWDTGRIGRLGKRFLHTLYCNGGTVYSRCAGKLSRTIRSGAAIFGALRVRGDKDWL